jgi:hypothetical protein
VLDCLDSNGEQRNETKKDGTLAHCDLVTISSETVLKRASVKKDNLYTSARQFYLLETRIYERLQGVQRPKGCHGFELFPKMVDKDGKTLLFDN